MRFKHFVGATPCGCPDYWGRHGDTTLIIGVGTGTLPLHCLLDNDLGLLY